MQQTEIREYEPAVPFFKQAFELSKSNNDSLYQIKAGIRLGEVYYDLGEPIKSQEILLFIETLFSEKIPSSLKAEVKLILGFAFDYQGKNLESIEQYEIGRLIADEEKDILILARLNNNLANAIIPLGQYDRALELAFKALEGFTSINNRYLIGRTNILIPVIYSYMGRTKEGEPFLLNAYKIAQEENNNILLRDSYYYLSFHYENQNNYSKAITFSEKGLLLSLEMANDQYTVLYYNKLGTLYFGIDEIDKALNYYNRAFKYYSQIGNKARANETRIKIASCFSSKFEYKEAERLLLEALSFYQYSEYHYYKGLTLIELGKTALKNKKSVKANDYLQEALSVGLSNNLFWIQYWSQQALVDIDESILSNTEKISLSQSLYDYSLKISLDHQLRSLQLLSSSYASINSDSTFFYADKALELIEKKRLGFSGGNLKAALFSDEAPFYNEVGSWYATIRKDYSRAFELVEASKARALLDQLAINNGRENFSISETDQIRLLELQKNVDRLHRSKEATSDNDEINRINEEIVDAELKYEAAIERVSSKNTELKSFLYPETLSLKQVQKLIDSKTAVIEYAFTNKSLLSFVITKKEVLLFEKKIEKSSIKNSIKAYREAIISESSMSELSVLSDSLSKYLLDPFMEHLSNIKNLVIVPDGAISLLPFEALVYKQSYLVQDYTIKYLPSVSVFNYIQSPLRKTSSSLLGLAGSGFIDGDDTNSSSTQTSFASLPYTLIEVDSIASNFELTTILKNDEVTEAAFKSLDLGNFKYLHFATHGDINEISPSQSGLLLSKKKETEVLFGEDGYLNANEITSLNLNADMVVLSACNTGMGKILDGEGLLGLQRSFLAAGASSVVSSLWSIYDRSTPLFMRYFYANLVEYEEKEIGFIDHFLAWANWYEPKLVDYKAMALRDAKLQMIEHPYYGHPVHWASFVITGK